MIQQLKRLQEQLDISITISITRGDKNNIDTEMSHDEEDHPIVPPYTETQLNDETVNRIEGWVENPTLQAVDDRHILANLNEILLILISIRGQATGKELSTDLKRVFGTELSSGTVYPRLKMLAEQNTLAVQELPRQKVYQIQDDTAVLNSVESDVNQTLAFALTLETLTIECIEQQLNQSYTESDHE